MRRLTAEAKTRLLITAAKRSNNRFMRQMKKKLGIKIFEEKKASRREFARRNRVPYVDDLNVRQIVLPDRLCFKTNFSDTATCLDQIRRNCLIDNVPVMLHFEHVAHLDPAAALVLVAEIYRCRNLRTYAGGWIVNGTYPRNPAIYKLMRDMGFFNLLNIRDDRPEEPRLDEDGSAYLGFITDSTVDGAMVDQFVTVIENHILKMNPVARGKLVGAIKEAMSNTLDHAHLLKTDYQSMPNRWWLSSRVNVKEHEVVIMLFDQGVGIPRTLEPTTYEAVLATLVNLSTLRGVSKQPSDGEMIKAATELHRTGTGQSGRGKGFRNMKQFVDSCPDGELRVLSNRGVYHYMSGTEQVEDQALSVGGTVIEWRFRSEETVVMHDE